jgi:hypothetical protein
MKIRLPSFLLAIFLIKGLVYSDLWTGVKLLPRQNGQGFRYVFNVQLLKCGH